MVAGVTLKEFEEQKKPSGFFPKLFENVCNEGGDKLIPLIEELREDPVGLFKFCYTLPEYKNALNIKEFYPEKNIHESKIKKEYGTKAYQDKKDIDAIYLYTQAVIAAPTNEKGQSKELSLCLANRSAVLFALRAYNLALEDIELALESGYPKELEYKLYERKAKCLMMYKQMKDSEEAYKTALASLDHAKLDADKKTKIQKDLQRAIFFFQKSNYVFNKKDVDMYPRPALPKLDCNSKYPAMSKAVEFRYESGRGRYAIAKQDIRVGQYICVEKSIVSHMLPDYMGSNCTNCFRIMKNPLPCPDCTKVMFCSMRCRKEALSSYHRYECKVVDFLIASGMSIVCFMAYRTISQKPLDFFLKNKELFSNHDEISGSKDGTNQKKYLSDDYRNLYNLVTHHSERKTGDMFHRSMLAVMLLKCLKSQGYFGGNKVDFSSIPEDILTEDEQYIGTLLVHFLEVYQFNAHEIAQFEMVAKDKEEGAKSVFIGAGVYPTLAMFNHSCDPSVVRYYVEDVVCVQAIKNIYKGDEINENYGPIFFHSPKAERQERLKAQYWFDCRCIPCTENWPLMHEMNGDSLIFRCEECGEGVPFETSANVPRIKCSCGTPIPILLALKKIAETEDISERAQEALNTGQLESAQTLYSSYITTLDKVIVPPYTDYYKIQQNIWKCIWMRFGNRVVKTSCRRHVIPQSSTDYDIVD
uniref:Protein-lysine N-methyltransferase SMYD4 n=1 Tax=Lepeophtheirus salmonis TaxID=72036 RepID=A0A0K2TLD8_LEPSM